jgi:hypothetical protein
MRPGGKDGFLYRAQFGAVLVGGAAVTIATAGWYKIKTKASAASGFPAKTGAAGRALAVGDVYYAQAGQTLAEGDSVIPITLNRISFVTDVSDQAQGQSYDVTTQDDIESGARAWIPSAFKDRSGTINGFVDTDSEEQRTLLGEYRKIVVDDGEHVTVHDAASVEHEFMLSKRETLTEGEIELWEYLPVISESINTSKPLDGAQPFSFNYKVDGKRKPCAYYRTVGA